ncbi:ABC transporter G family member 23-like isoform X2 [Rhodnius prolixus]|uniref:ABC transporter G family member 23-like isoform X2 n=1 Tax=Rhodnius prolixus TaxID=13249 RepID=UPI003D18EB10
MDNNRTAVTIREVYQTYDSKNYVLKGLNMHIPQGTIFGLLGSSGCGKTTLLNSVVGLVGFNSGTIELAVKSKKNMGFMPQKVGLHEQLTVEELLCYFGTLYGMTHTEMQLRMDLMFEVLDLPNRQKFIPELSGGQKRRVSMAVALIHDPELLILDEPTVGLDPILRHRIWQFLVNWCEDGSKTVLITTHYLEETKHTHTENTTAPIHCKQLIFSSLALTKETFAVPRFAAEFKKNVTYMWRNLSIAIFTFGLPFISILLFYYANGGEPEGFSLAVVNQDLSSCGNYKFQPEICSLNNLSCNYLHRLTQKTFTLVDHKEVSTAIDFAKNNHLWGVLHFVQDFTDALSARIEEPFIKDTVVVENSSIIIFLDSSNKIIHGIIERKLRDSYLEMATDIYQACGYPTKFTDLPIKFEEPIYGNTNPNVKEFLAPGLISLLMFGMPLLYGYVIVEEKNLGATSRSLVAGTTVIEVLAAHLILRVGIQLLQTFCSMVIMYWILQFPLENPFYSTILIILQGLAGIATSFLLSTNLNSFLGISGVVTGSFTVTLFISGMLWPLEGMHPSIKLLSWIAPCTFSTQSLRSLSIRGWDLTNREVYLGFISSCLWMLVSTLIIYLQIRRNKAKSFL